MLFPSTPGHINHISPILAFVAAVYYVFPDPVSLLILQSLAISFSIVPLYLLALRESGRAGVSLLVVGTYLANAGLHGIVRYDFHVEAFLPLFIFLVYYSYGSRSAGFYYLSLGLLLATIEYSAVLGLGIALSIWLEKKRIDRRILALIVSSGAILGIIAWSAAGLTPSSWNWPANWLTRQLFGGTQGSFGFQGLFVDLGSKVLYLFLVLAPTGLAAVRKLGRMIPAIPWVLILVVSSRMSYYSIDFQYSSFLIPFVYMAAIPYIKERSFHNSLVRVATLAVIIMLVFSALSPARLLLWSSTTQSVGWPGPSPLLQTIDSIRDSLPSNATILTQIDIFPHLTNKAYLTINHTASTPPQFILVNPYSPWYNWSDYKFGFPFSAKQQVEQLTTDFQYDLVMERDGLRFYRLALIP